MVSDLSLLMHHRNCYFVISISMVLVLAPSLATSLAGTLTVALLVDALLAIFVFASALRH